MMKSSLIDQEPAITDEVVAQAYDDLKFEQAIEDRDDIPPEWFGYILVFLFGAFYVFVCWLLIFYIGG